MKTGTSLRLIKLLHTAVWLGFVLCIMAIPVLGHLGRFREAAWLVAAVSAEILVLAFNRLRCPLTAWAARYTADRRDNFDIYLPEWLARHNKTIFGVLFVLGALFTLTQWLARVSDVWQSFRTGG